MFLVRSKHFSSVRMFSATVTPATNDVIFEFINDVGVISLNRPKVLNSLNEVMVTAIYNQLKEWESKCNFVIVKGSGDKAFCAGGDVVSATKDKNAGKSFFRNEYKMNYLIGMYKRPYVSICDGITMGGGVGISVHGPYRIATEKTLFAMPETAIGLFPDVGGSYFLPRLYNKMGLFLGLSGYRLQGIDVVKAGIATHFVHSEDVPKLIEKLLQVDADRIGEFLNAFSVDLSNKTFSLQPYKHIIESCFHGETLEEIYSLLWRDGSLWAKGVANMLEKNSPTALKVTKKVIDLGAKQNLRQCLKTEYRLACAALDSKVTPDFYEGVRALLIDKDKSPKWKPDHLEDVTSEIVDKCFEPLPESDELDI